MSCSLSTQESAPDRAAGDGTPPRLVAAAPDAPSTMAKTDGVEAAPKDEAYMRAPKGGAPQLSPTQSGPMDTAIPEHEQKRAATQAAQAAQQAVQVSSSVNVTAAPIEVVHRDATGHVMERQQIPVTTSVPVASGLGPRPGGMI